MAKTKRELAVGSEIKTAVLRLQESWNRELEDVTDSGIKCGREWALETAEVSELRRVAALIGDESMSVAEEPFMAVANAVNSCPGCSDAVEFWQSVAGEDVLDRFKDADELLAAFVFAFVTGAASVWDEVEDKVCRVK